MARCQLWKTDLQLYKYDKDHTETPLEDTMEALLSEQEKGNIRYIGVSNLNVEQIAQALEASRFDSLQPPYSLFFRYIEEIGLMQEEYRANVPEIAESAPGE